MKANGYSQENKIAKIVAFSKALDLPHRFSIAMVYLYCMESISMYEYTLCSHRVITTYCGFPNLTLALDFARECPYAVLFTQ